MALYLFIATAVYIPISILNIYQYSLSENINFSYFSFEISMLIKLMAAVLLWLFADKISQLIVKDVEVDTVAIPTTIDYKKLQYITFAVVGLVLFFSSLPTFGSSIYMFRELLSKGMMMKDTKEYYTHISKIVTSGVQLVFGLCLLIGSRGFVNAIISIRNLGTNRIEEKEL